MGTELGATTSIFPSDEVTRAFLKAQGAGSRLHAPLRRSRTRPTTGSFDIDLDTLEPLIACPHMPDKVVPVRSLKGVKVDQVCVGSCTNSSLYDLLKAAAMLKGRTVSPSVSMSVSPGSRQVLTMLADCGALSDILASRRAAAGMRLRPLHRHGLLPQLRRREPAHLQPQLRGPQRHRATPRSIWSPRRPPWPPPSPARSPIPRDSGAGRSPCARCRTAFSSTTAPCWPPPPRRKRPNVEVLRGPNIKRIPRRASRWRTPSAAKLTLKVGDNITTDHIMPAGAKILPYRSNIPKLSEFCFAVCDKDVPRARQGGRGDHHRRRQQLRPGLLARARGAGAPVSGRARRSSPRASPASTPPTSSTPASCR